MRHCSACVDTAFCLFSEICNSTLLCIVEFICYLIEIQLAVREWEREVMGITNGNGNKTRLNLGSEMGMNHWEWEGVGLKKTFPLISTGGTQTFAQQSRSEKYCLLYPVLFSSC